MFTDVQAPKHATIWGTNRSAGGYKLSASFPFNIYVTNSMKHSHTTCSLVNKFPPFCGNLLFITVFTKACHCSLRWARWSGQSTLRSRLTSLKLFKYWTFICAYVFRVFPFLQVSPSKPTHDSFSPNVLQATPIPSLLIYVYLTMKYH